MTTVAARLLLGLCQTCTMLCLSIVIVLGCPVDAVAQCNRLPNSTDQSTAGVPKLQASTTWCTGDQQTTVLGRIAFLSTSCATGSTDGPNCKTQTTGHNAVVTVYSNACGSWSGVSQHYYENSGGTIVYVQSDRTTALDAGSCGGSPADECAAQGFEYYWDGSPCVYTPGSPIAIATANGAKYRFTSLEDGVLFDIDGNGISEQVSWTEANSDIAFLALDRDGDGRITSGKELFGNHTLPGVANGFDALNKTNLATNGGVKRGSVSSDDPLFSRLLLWTDKNHNGVSEPSELRPVSELFSDIGLGYVRSGRQDRYGNIFGYKGWAAARSRPGRNRPKDATDEARRGLPIWDVYLKVQ